ncbi:hypothetical protein AB0D62_29430 [Streptomyces massasporeus]|uniref:hypothetical protein n=1 Tax=Streptomyces massasporeus TaxID=67324 RepID=UPI0033ECBB29
MAIDAQGRAQTPFMDLGTRKEGRFTVRAKTLGAETVFTVRVKESPYTVSVGGGNEQKTEQGEDFTEALVARVVKAGTAAPAGTEVEFRVEDTAQGRAPLRGRGPGRPHDRGDGTSTTGGTSTDLDGGSLASTGAGGIGLLLAAAALAAVGFAVFRIATPLKLRSRDSA